MTQKIAFAGIVFLCVKYYCTIVHNRTKVQKFTYFHNQKQKKLRAHTYLICERHFFFNEHRRLHSAVTRGHETHTNDKRKEKRCQIHLFTEIITIFATQL